MNQYMHVVRHDAICIDVAGADFCLHVFWDNLSEWGKRLDERPVVLRGFKDVLTIDAAYHNVVDEFIPHAPGTCPHG